jgi:Tfp pilus assembly protein PilW
MVTITAASVGSRRRDDAGFSLVEFLIAAGIAVAMLGSAVALASQVQRSYGTELDDVAAQEEGRFALDWIGRLLRSAGNNPYDITVSGCPAAGTAFQALRFDPDLDGLPDDVRIQADVNPANGLLAGLAGTCTEAGEDITIAHDAVNSVITRRDNAVDAAPQAMTDRVFTNLTFTYLDRARAVTADPDAVAYVQTSVTVRSRARNPHTGQFTTTVMSTEVRLRTR